MWQIFLTYCLLCVTSSCIASKEENLNELGNSTLKDHKVMHPAGNSTCNGTADDINDNFSVPWDTYIALLLKVSNEQIENVKANTKKYYKLSEEEKKAVDHAFNGSNTDFEQMLQNNLKIIIAKDKFNATPEFMLDFTDLSNFILEQIIEYNLGRVNGQLLLPTKWYQQIMRQKILRQQSKIATNFVESHICTTLSLCKDRLSYTEYLVEWLRQLLNVSSFNLHTMYSVVPIILEKNMHTIKSNIKFKKTIKYIVNSNDVVKRDTIDYLDEVITNQKNVVNIVPMQLKKAATVMVELFKVLDDNYDMNEENEDQLENITELFMDWINGGKTDIKDVLERILENMQLNLKIWPLDVQRKVDLTWSKITGL